MTIIDQYERACIRRNLRPRSIEKMVRAARQFDKAVDGAILSSTRQDVESYLDNRQIGARTRYWWISTLHAFYDWAITEGLTTDDPTKAIARPKMRRSLPRPMSDEDLRRALDVAPPKERCWVALAALQGLRCQEIAGLRRDDVLDSEGLLRVVHGKGGHERLLPLHREVLAALRALPMPRSGDVFQRPRGGPYSPAQLSEAFNYFLRSAGVDATAHQLRHWFGTHMYGTSHDLRLTQEMLGHANPATTAIYTAFDRTNAAAAMQSLALPSTPDEAA